MRHIEGYSFKENTLTIQERAILDEKIAESLDVLVNAYVHKHKDRTYISTNDGILSIYGIGNKETLDTTCTLWGTSDQVLYDAVRAIGKNNSVFPYNVRPNTCYLIRNGQVFETKVAVGNRVSTPGDKNGKIRVIDEAICVELDDDPSMLYEYDIDELTFPKDA